MQLIARHEGAAVLPGKREYGRATLRVSAPPAAARSAAADLFHGFDPGDDITVWCSHGDHVDEPPPGFVTLAATADLPVAAFRARSRPLYGVQFHPEVAHTPRGQEIVDNFLFRVCGCRADWTPGAFVAEVGGADPPTRWAMRRSSAGSPAAWTRRWRRRWCTGPWATS